MLHSAYIYYIDITLRCGIWEGILLIIEFQKIQNKLFLQPIGIIFYVFYTPSHMNVNRTKIPQSPVHMVAQPVPLKTQSWLSHFA